MGHDDAELWIDSWHAAAERATFTPFEAVGGPATRRWAGGFGGDPGVTTHLQVMAAIDGIEVAVDTTPRQERASTSILAHDLVSRHTIGQHDIELPFTITVVRDDRTLSVDGEPVRFAGLRLEGHQRWVGWAEVDGLTVAVTAEAPVDVTIRRCRDVADLAEHPPT